MRVYVYPADLGGCGYYRLIWPTKILQDMGHDVRLVHPKTLRRISGGTDDNGRLVQINIPSDADVMVFQRVASKLIVDGIKIMRDNGIAVVVDIDDDMSAIHPTNPAFAALHPKFAKEKKLEEYDWESARRSCTAATMVTTSTQALIPRYAPHGRGRVVHNCVPEVFTRIAHNPQPGVIGWGGSLHSHTDDIAVVGVAMSRLQREGFKFKVVGPSYGTKSAFKLDREPLTTEIVKLGEWPHELTKLEVGIAPLNATRFNEAKSWLKMMEYAALGVPCVGSPRAEYRRIHDLGIGLLADNPRDWYRHARRLLDDENLRSEMSVAGRQVIIDHLTLEANAWRWWEAWSDAFSIERGPLGQKPTRATV